MILDPDRSLMVLNNTIRDGKTQAGPLAYFFRRKKGVKDALLQTLRDARAAVTKRQMDHAFRYVAGDRQQLARGIGHRVTGVGEQVNKDLLQLNGITNDHRVCRAEIQRNLDL